MGLPMMNVKPGQYPDKYALHLGAIATLRAAGLKDQARAYQYFTSASTASI